MNRKKPKILVLVEGEKTDVRLMRELFNIYELDAQYEIVPMAQIFIHYIMPCLQIAIRNTIADLHIGDW